MRRDDVGDIIWDKIVGTFIHEVQFLKVSSICKSHPHSLYKLAIEVDLVRPVTMRAASC